MRLIRYLNETIKSKLTKGLYGKARTIEGYKNYKRLYVHKKGKHGYMVTDTEKVSLDDMIKIGSEFWFGTLKELHAALNERISAGEGQDLEITIGDSRVLYELVKGTKIVYVHDVYVESSDRGKGLGTKLVNAVVKKHRGYTFWIASTASPMNRVSEKAGFEKICDKNYKNCKVPEEDLPSGVAFENATVYRLKT